MFIWYLVKEIGNKFVVTNLRNVTPDDINVISHHYHAGEKIEIVDVVKNKKTTAVYSKAGAEIKDKNMWEKPNCIVLFDYTHDDIEQIHVDKAKKCLKINLIIRRNGDNQHNECIEQGPIFILTDSKDIVKKIDDIEYVKELYYTDEVITIKKEVMVSKKRK